MDGESSYESDISESWSLIDINLNEESLSTAEASPELDNNLVRNLEKEKLKVTKKTDLEEFLRKCKEENRTSFSHVSDSDSESLNDEGLPSNDRIETDSIGQPFERNSENIEKNDSCDADSIEILDMESNCPDSEVERLDVSQIKQLHFSTYQSDDEESLEGNTNDDMSNNSPVIRRRKRRLNKISEEAVNSINSENRLPNNDNLTFGTKDENHKLNEESNKVNSHPVYKHYRNNVANTVLSLSVGLIFAGVACIAIGHFLGVQDAAQTAVELVETLKKLEVENAALQSHLLQLNKALQIRESKSENLLDQPQSKVSREQIVFDSSKTRGTEADFSGIHSNVNFIEELARRENYAQKNNKVTDTAIDFNEFGKFIQDKLHSLKMTQERGAKILEEADKKISKELQDIINRLSSSQKDMANLNENVVKLKNIIDKIEKIIPESLKKLESQNPKHRKRIPVTELDLQTMSWSPKNKMKKPDQTYSESVTLYEFPKPEIFYKIKKDIKKEYELINSNKVLKNDTSEDEGKVVNKIKKHKNDKKKKGEKKHLKDSRKKKEFKEGKGRKIDKKQKWFLNQVKKVNPLKKDGLIEERNKKFMDINNKFNRTTFQNNKFSKLHKNVKTKRKAKKIKNINLNKILLSKLRKESSCMKKRNHLRMHTGPELFNLTGHWVFKWANGRDEIRKNEMLSDWQFERAKARKERRDEDYEENWQFKRAGARESNRNDHRGKYTGKEFFHEGFSWI